MSLGRLSNVFAGIDIPNIVISIIVILTAITVHEYCHGYAALRMGDHTAQIQGRLSLNPLAHIDIVGALCMLIFHFGWANPVPINPNNFKNPKKGTVIVSLAGPLSNIGLSLLGVLLYGIFYRLNFGLSNITFARIFYGGFLSLFIQLNLYFAIFNLIPIPPLDGAKILFAFLPPRIYFKLMKYERYSFFVLILLLWSGIISSVLGFITSPIISSYNWVIGLIAGL